MRSIIVRQASPVHHHQIIESSQPAAKVLIPERVQ